MASLLCFAAPLRGAALALGLAVLPATGMAADCTVPPEAFLFEPTLPRLVGRLNTGKPVTIVAIGGASTEGRAAGAREFAWPGQLGAALKRDFPAVTVTVVNLGRGRQTAAEMVGRFATDILPKKPNLVVWETGTVDAVRGVDLDAFRDTLQTGIEQLQPAADVVIMDMQFSRRTHAMIDFEPYGRALRLIADVNDIPVFPRNDLMREWSETGEIDFGATGKDQRQRVARKLYRCIGEALAIFLVRRPEGGDAPR
jgi:lysophospholipase L1-like esterase